MTRHFAPLGAALALLLAGFLGRVPDETHQTEAAESRTSAIISGFAGSRRADPLLASRVFGGNSAGSGDSRSVPTELRLGIACHAFEHLGNIDHQAEAAAEAGATIIYASGIGSDGYSGLPPARTFSAHLRSEADYVRRAKELGIRRALGYVCSTSIVGLEGFDKNWPAEFRARFKTSVKEWLQQDIRGQPLPSWYGGDYRPACMNNPDWRSYEKFIVEKQIGAGHGGVFFDNPTVHPQGCYCPFCLDKFADFLKKEGVDAPVLGIKALRRLAAERPSDFIRFRATTARDFLEDMRGFARSIDPDAWITANNSLNAPGALYAQSRRFGLNIFEMSRAEDLVVIEDMESQPRLLVSGETCEYGPTYRQLRAVSHGKPIVAVTIAEGDYHTPPNLIRLAMAEAAANGASYMVWAAWPEAERGRMAAAVRRQADFLRKQEGLLNDTEPRSDAVVFLPFRRWTETDVCSVSSLAEAMTRANVQYVVISEEDFSLERLRRARVLVLESLSVLKEAERKVESEYEKGGGRVVSAEDKDWLKKVQAGIGAASVELKSPSPNVRVCVHDQPGRTIVHIVNLNVRRLSSFEDEVGPVESIDLAVRVPFGNVRSVHAFTPDDGTDRGLLEFKARRDKGKTQVETKLKRLEVGAILIVEK